MPVTERLTMHVGNLGQTLAHILGQRIADGLCTWVQNARSPRLLQRSLRLGD